MPAGTLFLIVGPSGAGKDTLLNLVRARLMREGQPHHFPRRLITRPADAGSEDHIALSEQEFATRVAAGEMALHWRANGLGYGIDGAMRDALSDGRPVVVNTSRAAVGRCRNEFPRVRVVLVEAPRTVLRDRLVARGRETPVEIDARLARNAQLAADLTPDHVVLNDGVPEAAAELLYRALTEELTSIAASSPH